ncbi:hypothetical protein KP79_PYT02307 [Mizuhopecten yessoensis]|uniref:Uncharacterized protein n=2 Tax=Mizuhopecten yessoensis TaxID=6573 RepID=A0A210PRT3_MIZYE|nr:hypothetical protein KP79_PYT02307 [Mizuhopecten yessoensis]
MHLEDDGLRRLPRENSPKGHSVDTLSSEYSTDNGPSGQSEDTVQSGNSSSSGCCTDIGSSKHLEDKSMIEHLTDNSPSGQSVDTSQSGLSTDNSQSGNPSNSTSSGCCADNGSHKYLEDKSMSGHLTDNGPGDHLVDTCTSDFSTDIGQSGQSADSIQNGCSLGNSQSGHSADQSPCGQFGDNSTSEMFSVNGGNERSVDTGPSGLSPENSPNRCCIDNGSSSHLEDNGLGGHSEESSVDTCTSQHSPSVDTCTSQHSNGPSGNSTDKVRKEDTVKISLNEHIADISPREVKEETTENHKESDAKNPCMQDKALDKIISTQSINSDISMTEEPPVKESNALPSDFVHKDDKSSQRNENDTKSIAQTNFEEIGNIVVRRNTSDVEDSVSVANLHDSGQMGINSSKVQEMQIDTNCNSLNNKDTKQSLHSEENTNRNDLQKSREEEDHPMENPDFTRVCTVQENEDRQKIGIKNDSNTDSVELFPESHRVDSFSERGSSVSSEICPLQEEQAGNSSEIQSGSSKSIPFSPTGDHESCPEAEQKHMRKKPYARNANSHSTWTKFDDNFRLPLATKGFHFNFRKTGKKPKCWFMELDVMDEEAKKLQLQYLCRKAGLVSSGQIQSKKRQASVSDQMKRRKQLSSACRIKGIKSKDRSCKQHGKGPTLTNISKDFVKECRDTNGSSGIAQTAVLTRAHRSYTSRLDGEKVSKEDLFKLNKSEGTMLKPKLSIVSNEVSESCMQKVKGVSMTTRNLPFKKKYIKLEIDEEGRCINPEDNCPIEETKGRDGAGKIEDRKEIKFKIGINPGNGFNDKEANSTEVNKNLFSEIEVNNGEINKQQELNEKDAGQGQVLRTDTKIHSNGEKHRKGAMKKKVTYKTRAVKFGMKRTKLRKESDCSDDRSNICVDSPKSKPNMADFKMETEKSVKLKLQEKIKKRKVESRTKSNKTKSDTLVCSLDTDEQIVMTNVDERKKAKKRKLVLNKKSRQCSVCMRDVLFGKKDSDKNSGDVTCPSCELDCQLSSEFKANRRENRYEKLDFGSDSEECDEDELFSRNVYVVMPPADKTLITAVAKPTRVYCKPNTGHIKTYVVSKEMNKETSYELTDIRDNVDKTIGRTTETIEKVTSQNQNQLEFITREVHKHEVLKTPPGKGSFELEEPAEFKPNIESLDFQVHVNNQDNSMTELETAPKDSSNFEIRMDYTRVKEEMVIQCHEERSGDGKMVINNQPLHIHATNTSISDSSAETSSGATTTNINRSENLSYAYFCTGTSVEDANSNNNNIMTSDTSVSQVRIKTSISKEDVCEGSEQESDTKIYVYCDDVAAMRLATGKENQGQSAKAMLWNDPCVKTVVEDLGKDTRFISGQVENITVSNYLGHKVKIEKDEDIYYEVPDLVDDPVMQSSRDMSVMKPVIDNTATDITASVSTDTKPLPIYHLSEGDVKYHVQETQNQSSEPNLVPDNTSVADEESAQCLPIILDVRSIKQEPDFDSFV